MFHKALPNNSRKSEVKFLKSWGSIDWSLLLLVVGLTIFSAIVIQSTQLYEKKTDWLLHLIFGGLGTTTALIIARWRYELLIQWHWLTYAITNLLLIAVILMGVTANGAQSWLSVGGFNVQPSEFAKLGLIITLAAILHNRPATTILGVLQVLAIAAFPWILILLQPDLGTSLVFGAITLGMLYWGNTNPGWLIIMVSPIVSAILFNLFFPGWLVWAIVMGIIAWLTLPWKFLSTIVVATVNFAAGELGAFLWGFLKEYQKDRLTLFVHPEKDPLGGGYHLIQSRIAIGSGEIWGKGLYHGTQTQLNFVPEQHTDFIFSAVGEEFGFIGGVCILLVFWLICFRLVYIAFTAKENLGSLIAIGVLSMIFFQVVINIGMTVGLAPITGIPLPWMSYGGSSLLTNFLAIGVVESVANYRQKKNF